MFEFDFYLISHVLWLENHFTQLPIDVKCFYQILLRNLSEIFEVESSLLLVYKLSSKQIY